MASFEYKTDSKTGARSVVSFIHSYIGSFFPIFTNKQLQLNVCNMWQKTNKWAAAEVQNL